MELRSQWHRVNHDLAVDHDDFQQPSRPVTADIQDTVISQTDDPDRVGGRVSNVLVSHAVSAG